MFVVSLTYTCKLSKIEEHLDAHIKYLEQQYKNGVFLASGRKEPRTGGVILARAESLVALETILSVDPFKINGLAKYEITEFIPTKTSVELEFLQNQ